MPADLAPAFQAHNQASKRLILAGFVSDAFRETFQKWDKLTPEEKKKQVEEMKESDAEKYADHHKLEIQRDQMMLTPYPSPKNAYYMIYEVPHESIEPLYFWCLGHVTNDWGYPVVHKISDIFTASEHSSFYGASAQRLGLAQDKVAQYLATIGKMVKDMFQLVRELRWIDERKKYYEDADKGLEGAEIALKGLWADMVDGVVGGQRTSSNVFVMAQQLQFSALPDMFFNIHVSKHAVGKLKGKPADKVTDEEVRGMIDKMVEKQSGGFNKELKNILKRKLYQYLVWKVETWLEIQQRRRFTLDYLQQHYQVIRLYMTWVKPYLKHIQKLGADLSKISSADLVAAFESSLIEIEFLAQQIPKGNSKYYSCILMTFQYRTRPQMSFSQEGGYHRGPLHQGETRIFWRAYGWTQEQINSFIAMKEAEDLELLGVIDKSMEALHEDLTKYLTQARELHEEKRETKKAEPKLDLLEPFREIGKGFGETFTAIIPRPGKGGTPAVQKAKDKAEKGTAEGSAKFVLWQCYKNFKKAHRLLTW